MGMTMTQKILAAHAGLDSVEAGLYTHAHGSKLLRYAVAGCILDLDRKLICKRLVCRSLFESRRNPSRSPSS